MLNSPCKTCVNRKLDKMICSVNCKDIKNLQDEILSRTLTRIPVNLGIETFFESHSGSLVYEESRGWI